MDLQQGNLTSDYVEGMGLKLVIFVGRQLCWKDHLVFICNAVCNMDVQMYVLM